MKESELGHKYIVTKRGWIKCLYLNGYKPIIYVDPKTIARIYYNTEGFGEHYEMWGKKLDNLSGLVKIDCNPSNETFVIYTENDHTWKSEELIDEVITYIGWYKMNGDSLTW